MGYCLVHPAQDDSVASISDVVGGGGVRIDKVDRKAARITGQVPAADGTPACRVTLTLYSRLGLSFVEIVCEAIGTAGGGDGLVRQVARLKGLLRESLPVEPAELIPNLVVKDLRPPVHRSR